MIGPMIAGLALQAAVPADQSRSVKPANDESTWVTTDDYPVMAVKNGVQSVTGTRLTISRDGRVIRCEITISSGNADLDAAACSTLSARALFHPALDILGQPIESYYTKRVRWVLPDADLAYGGDGPAISWLPDFSPTSRSISLRYHVNAEGLIDQCLWSVSGEESESQPSIDMCQLLPRFNPRISSFRLVEGWYENYWGSGFQTESPEWAASLRPVPAVVEAPDDVEMESAPTTSTPPNP